MTDGRGLFVAVDGPSGVGKSTLVGLLAEALQAAGYPTCTTAEPTDSDIGRLARSKVDSSDGAVLACLFAADLYQNLVDVVRPHLAEGHAVVADRYVASGLVMQRLDDVEPEYLQALNVYADKPDVAVMLTADPRVVRARLRGRGTHNRYQDQPGSSHRECRYFDAAAEYLEGLGVRVMRIDTTDLSPAAVVDAVVEELTPLWATSTEPMIAAVGESS